MSPNMSATMSRLNFDDLDKYLLSQHGKIIHQVWFGTIPNKKEANKYYKTLKRYRDSWKNKNPYWAHIEWNKNMCINLIKNHYPQHLNMFQKYKYEIQRCDSIRYFILHRYGGLYADMDYYCNRSWDEVVKKYSQDLYLVQTPNMGSEKNEYVSNSLMYSKPNHKFWPYLFLELNKFQKSPIYYTRHISIMYTTGPGILNRVYGQFKRKLKLSFYPAKLFHPHGISDNITSLTNNKQVYAIHLGKGSWEKHDSKFFLFLFREWKVVLAIIVILLIPLIVIKLKSKYP